MTISDLKKLILGRLRWTCSKGNIWFGNIIQFWLSIFNNSKII